MVQGTGRNTERRWIDDIKTWIGSYLFKTEKTEYMYRTHVSTVVMDYTDAQ